MSTSAVHYATDANGIVTLTLDDPGSSANTMNDRYRESMRRAVDRLLAEVDAVAGVIVTSAKRTFFAGGDLTQLKRVTKETAQAAFDNGEAIKADLRRLELLGKPVVAVLNGTALGGGLEIALACHRRIAVDAPGAVFGLPEVTLGLLPGGGGVTRTVRMLGVIPAVTKVLAEGRRFSPVDAQALGLVDEVHGAVEDAMAAARAWIAANPTSAQPWDLPGYRLPGGTPAAPALAAVLPSLPALTRKQLKGADYPAPKAILAAAVEGSQVDFDTASRIESRYLVELTTGNVAKNMIQAFFFDMQSVNRGASRPASPTRSAERVAVLGAGMMGAGIAYACSVRGLEVVLKDVSLDAAARGKQYTAKLLDTAVSRGKITAERRDDVLARIAITDDAHDLAGADVVIEAVFEEPGLKKQVLAEAARHARPDALLCSNTSTLPITDLADGVERPADLIGLHFFSPVDKMPLVEIVVGNATSDEAIARAFDLVRQIGKTPIVVNDSRGFFTSRVIATFVNEGLAMLAEGISPVSIERAATQAGYPVGPLQLTDELNLELMAKIRLATAEAARAEGRQEPSHPADAVLYSMIALGRSGRLARAGFYDYVEGTRAGLWTGLAATFPRLSEPSDIIELRDRFLFVESLEAIRCLQEGVLRTVADGNVGSLLGIGFPGWTGGALQFVEGYPGGRRAYLDRAAELAARHGDRFAVPDDLAELTLEQAAVPVPA